MLEINTILQVSFDRFRSFLFVRGEDRVPAPIKARCAGLISGVDTLRSERDQYRCLSAFRLLDSHVIADIKKRSLLTIPATVLKNGTPVKQVFGGGLSMNGTIRCAKCNKQMTQHICNNCGEHKCYISLYWKQKNETQGKHHRFYKGKDGFALDFAHAERQITLMRSEIDRKTFSLDDWNFAKVKERLLENVIYKWLAAKQEEKESLELAKSTVKTYTSYTRNHYVPFFQGIDVRDIQDEDIKRFSSALRKKSLGIRMRRNIINTLHSFFVWLIGEGIIKQKDLPFFPRINGNDSSVKVALEVEDQQESLERIPEIHKDIYEFAFETGVRPGELAALQVKDVILKKGIVIVQRTYSACELKEAPKEELKKPIPLSDRAYELVEKNIQGKFPESFLFINPNTGNGYTANNLGKIWRNHSGISVTFNESARHSFCTQIVESGATEFEAQILMRHSDPRSTRAYFHANVMKYRDIVNRRGRIVKFPKKKEGQGE